MPEAAKKKKPPGRRKMVRKDNVVIRREGRPEKWRAENMTIVAAMARQGMTRREIAEALQVNRETIWSWEQKRPEFSNILHAASQEADYRVEASIYERAVGYEYRCEKVFQYKGRPVRVQTKQHIPADPQLAMFWLKNRQPERWKDRMEVQHSHLFNFVGLLPTDEEWIARYCPVPEPIVIQSNLPLIEDKSEEEDK